MSRLRLPTLYFQEHRQKRRQLQARQRKRATALNSFLCILPIARGLATEFDKPRSVFGKFLLMTGVEATLFRYSRTSFKPEKSCYPKINWFVSHRSYS